MTPKSDKNLISSHNITPKSHIKVTRINPLTPKSDKNLISPNSITLGSNIAVLRIKEMIPNSTSSWLLDKLSFWVPQEMFTEQYGELADWC